jgi:hypothetical protein
VVCCTRLHQAGLLVSQETITPAGTRIGVGLSGALDMAGNPTLAEGHLKTDAREVLVLASALNYLGTAAAGGITVDDLAECAPHLVAALICGC